MKIVDPAVNADGYFSFSPWAHIVDGSWEYRIELHEYVVQSGQVNVVQLFYLLKIRGLEVGKLRNACFSVPFYMGFCLRISTAHVKDHHICVNRGSVVSAACTKKKSKGHTAKDLIEIQVPGFGQREQK